MPCDEKNILVREGTSQLNRVLAALSPGYAKLDERDPADIILFAKRYAAYLNYFDPSTNAVDGNWEALMKMDISVTLATLMKIDIQSISNYKKLLYKRIMQAENDDKARTYFRFLFDLVFSLVKIMDDQFRLLPADLDYKIIFKNSISDKMQPSFVNLDHLNKIFSDAAGPDILFDPATTSPDSQAPFNTISSIGFDKSKLSDEWFKVKNISPPPDTTEAVPDISISVPSVTVKEKIIYVINHNIFNEQIESVFKATAGIISMAEKMFLQTLENFPSHTPHYALFLSFIKLFRHAQDHLNTYTQRHLDFYYKDVLQLRNKNPEPDSAHLVFELQKPVQKHLLKKDTLFKGGKDSDGKEICYVLPGDIVLNKAAVVKIHSQLLVKQTGKLMASPVANSADGEGAKILEADKSWSTFGDPRKIKNAKPGFAIASNMLFLNEGKRVITVTIHFAESIHKLRTSPGFDTNCFIGKLTGNKDWVTINEVRSSFETDHKLVFTITLSPDDPPIVPFSEKIHKEEFDVELPLLKIYLNQDKVHSIPYTSLANKRVASIEIDVDVTGVRDLVLSHDTGTIDASKPFKPFGDFPKDEASFYIGSKELFQKPLKKLILNSLWESSRPNMFAGVNFLSQGSWKKGATLEGSVIKDFRVDPTAMDFSSNEQLKPTTLEGFIRIKLNDNSYSLKKHLEKVSAELKKTELKYDEDSIQYVTMPATPVPQEIVLESLSIDYKASQTISFSLDKVAANEKVFYTTRFGSEAIDSPKKISGHQILFYHLNPFGYYRPDRLSHNNSSDLLPGKMTLLPVTINEGELFLGFENAEEDSVITILFQVADGSSNPLKNMQPLKWYYLGKHNTWTAFDNRAIIDGTVNFTQSGIVTITLPSVVIQNNTAFEKGFFWIKATVKQHPDAVCKMILVKAQAGRVTLVQDDVKKIEFRKVLPASSISKLLISDPAIKTIAQPFDSAGGRIRESDDHFYVRVSERLRHKQRAITIWDYEHIVLERFKEIYKVKCLNHTGFYQGKDGEVFCENYPGHVTIIPIPDLKGNTHVNPLRPYTSIGLLNNIKSYLKTIISPFVKLHVVNPRFEPIRLGFKVKFHDQYDVSFYRQLLNMEIEKFLCPWAWDQLSEISFGGKIIKSALLNFVEERPYVDYVSCFTMDHYPGDADNTIPVKTDVEIAVGSTSRSVIVSYFNTDEKDETKRRQLIEELISCDC